MIERAIVGASSIPPSPALGPAGAPPNVEPAAVDTGLLKLPSKLPNEVRFNPTNLCHSPNGKILNEVGRGEALREQWLTEHPLEAALFAEGNEGGEFEGTPSLQIGGHATTAENACSFSPEWWMQRSRGPEAGGQGRGDPRGDRHLDGLGHRGTGGGNTGTVFQIDSSGPCDA